MKPEQPHRTRGRPAGAHRESGPLTRTHESNGPDVKIRGTTRHIAEKYLQLARDAHSGGNPVAAENYLQHAEHYFRLIATAQNGPRETGQDDPNHRDADDVARGMPDRFALPLKPAQPPHDMRNGAPRREPD